MPKKVRIGLIGCGGMMQYHVNQHQAIKASKIAALVDPSEANLKRMIERFPHLAGLPTFEDYEEMLDEVIPWIKRQIEAGNL